MAYDPRIYEIAAIAALAAGKNANVAPQLLVGDITFTLADAVEDGRLILGDAPNPNNQMAGEMSELLELATRCEAAEGPDRGLDAAIYALDPSYADKVSRASGLWPKGSDPAKREKLWARQYAPAYTASLDAAMTLYVYVPERVPSNPRLATAEALRQRAEHV